MGFLILSIAVLAVSTFFLYRRLALLRTHPAGAVDLNIVIIVKDQEQWIEGFVRKLFFRIRGLPYCKVFFINDGSTDKTPEMLFFLQNYYPFELLSGSEINSESDIIKIVDPQKLLPTILKYDTRGFTEKEFLCAPLFSHLSRFHAGNSVVLSKYSV